MAQEPHSIGFDEGEWERVVEIADRLGRKPGPMVREIAMKFVDRQLGKVSEEPQKEKPKPKRESARKTVEKKSADDCRHDWKKSSFGMLVCSRCHTPKR